MLVDDAESQCTPPTHDAIISGFRWLSQGVNPGDVRFLHYSGHGGSLPIEPTSSKPPGSMDQTIFPLDHDQGKKQIRDYVIYDELVSPISCRR